MNIYDTQMPLIFACLAFLVISFLSAGILIHLGRVRNKREMLEKVRSDENQWVPIETDIPALGRPKIYRNPFVNFLRVIGMKANPGKSTDGYGTRLRFLQAGLRGEQIVSVFWGTKILLATCFVMGFLMFAVVFLQAMSSSHILFIAPVLALFGLMLPDIWIRVRAKRRQKRIERGFPDSIDLLVVCVESGMGLDAAIHKVAEEIGLTHPELGEELKLVNLELRGGKARAGALRNLAERTGIEDVKSLVTLLIQTDRFGTSIAQALRVYSDSFRTARYQRAEEIAAKMGTKLIFPLVLCIFPSFFVVILGPVVIQVFRMFILK